MTINELSKEEIHKIISKVYEEEIESEIWTFDEYIRWLEKTILEYAAIDSISQKVNQL